MARERVVMTGLEDAGPQVSVVRYVYCTIMKEETCVGTRPLVLRVWDVRKGFKTCPGLCIQQKSI